MSDNIPSPIMSQSSVRRCFALWVGYAWIAWLLCLCCLNSQAATRGSLYISMGDSLKEGNKSAGEDTTRVHQLCSLAASLSRSKPHQTVEYGLQALSLAEKIHFRRGQADAFNQIGNGQYRLGNDATALEYCMKARSMYEEFGDSRGIAEAMNRVGLIYKRQKNYPKALEFFQQSLALYTTIGNKREMANPMNNLGEAWRTLEDYSQALSYFYRTFVLDSALGDTAMMASSLGNIAITYQRMKQYDTSRAIFRQSLRLGGDLFTTAEMLRGYAWLAYDMGDYQTALDSALRALHINQEAGFRGNVKFDYEILATIYAVRKDFGQAFRFQKLLTDLKDTLFSAETTQKIIGTAYAVELERKQGEIKVLQAEQTTQTVLRNALLAGMVLLVLVVVLLGNRYRLKKRSETALREYNNEILRHQEILEQQALEIEYTNAALQENNAHLASANQELDAVNEELQRNSDELYRTNSELDSSNEQLQRLNHENNEFLGIAAHDLKNPLTSIKINASMIRIHAERLTIAQVSEAVERIEITADRMYRIVLSLLDANALESGKMSLNPELFVIAPIVQDVVAEYAVRAARKGILVHLGNWNQDVHEQIMVFADKQKTVEILENLLSNAVKYSPSGKRVLVYLKTSNEAARIEVLDQGPGLNEEDKQKLFGKFARLSAKPTGGEHSTGLGLSIVKKLVEAMGGRVWCESDIGAGATFIVELPTKHP